MMTQDYNIFGNLLFSYHSKETLLPTLTLLALVIFLPNSID